MQVCRDIGNSLCVCSCIYTDLLYQYHVTFQHPNPAASEFDRRYAAAQDHHGDVQHKGADPEDVGAAGCDQRQDKTPHPHTLLLRDKARRGREGSLKKQMSFSFCDSRLRSSFVKNMLKFHSTIRRYLSQVMPSTMKPYDFIPTSAFTDLGNVLDEAGSEKREEQLLPGIG